MFGLSIELSAESHEINPPAPNRLLCLALNRVSLFFLLLFFIPALRGLPLAGSHFPALSSFSLDFVSDLSQRTCPVHAMISKWSLVSITNDKLH